MNALRCAVCERDWSAGPDDTGDPMVSWFTDHGPEPVVHDFGLVCQGSCSRAWQKHHHELDLSDAHLSWWTGTAGAFEQLARVLETYRWPAALSARVARFAVLAGTVTPKRGGAKR